MSTLVNAAVIGAHSTLPTAAQLAILNDYDKGLGSPGHAVMHATPNSLYAEEIDIKAAVNAATVPSVIRKAPWPTYVWAVDASCESAAGSACTIDLQVDPLGGTSFVSVLAAALDVKTTAGTVVRGKPTAEGYLIPYGATYKVVCAATGAGAVVGARATLWCQHG